MVELDRIFASTGIISKLVLVLFWWEVRLTSETYEILTTASFFLL